MYIWLHKGTVGIAFNLESTNVGVVLMGDGLLIQEGSSVKATGKIAQIPVSEAYLGCVINTLAKPIDGRGEISSSEYRLIESPAPGIIPRRSVYEPLQTGLISIDSMIPIGRGQRELIIGDRQTGKTADTMSRRTPSSQSNPGTTTEKWTPEELIISQEKLLQEVVDALLDNGICGQPMRDDHNRIYKSLSDVIEGKEGRVRETLLGKRIDYSGRSVIVVGPSLSLHRCGLPREIAIELFQAFVIRDLIRKIEMIEVFLFGIVLGLIPITLAGLFVTAYLHLDLLQYLSQF